MKYNREQVLYLIRKTNKLFPPNKPRGELNFGMNWTNESWNLGDTLLLSLILPKAYKYQREMYIFSYSSNFQPLMTFNEYFHDVPDNDLSHYNNLMNLEKFDYGGGHWLQIQCRAMAFDIDIKPKPYLNYKCEQIPNTILINLEGITYNHLTKIVVPIIQRFVDDNKNNYHFVETFERQNIPYLRDVEYFQLPITEMIKKLATFEYFIGLNSGLMHIAAALDVKGIIITDGPQVDRFYLPKPNCNNTDYRHMDYLFPQNVHLHPYYENELVKRLTLKNLSKAINGEIYPYWSDDFLDIVLENLNE
jgi:hypothetical protein